MGWGDWSRTGGVARTPSIDAWSRSETTTWFHRAYSGNPICSPTRASLQTGRTPARTCIYGVEQHILCRAGAGGCAGSEYSLANASKDSQKGDYLTGFYGKWHLGSLSDRGVGSADCYEKPPNTSCLLGYWERDGGCCFGVDGQLDVANPLQFGYDETVATPECAASATTNCGCFFYPAPHNDTPCELGHYHQHPGAPPFNECMQYYRGNRTVSGTAAAGSGVVAAKDHQRRDDASYYLEPLDFVTPVDDEQFLVDQFEGLLERSVRASRPFLAVICFHGVHIPYVATPATRATYAKDNHTLNEQDYYGTITQIDAAVGRVRRLLDKFGVGDNTFMSLFADNGPEVDPAGGQGTGSFPNPGRTDGLRGRKRDVTEGGTRVIGLVDYPPAALRTPGGRVLERFPISTSDIMPTVLDLLGLESYQGRPLDGISLLPVLRGDMEQRPQAAGIGTHGSFRFGSTNHKAGPDGKETYPDICPEACASAALGDIPSTFSTVGNLPQWSWAEGNDLKLFGCRGHCDGTNCNSTRPGYRNEGWKFFLFNLTADRAETKDLWESKRRFALGMLDRFQKWQDSVRASQGPDELGCAGTSFEQL